MAEGKQVRAPGRPYSGWVLVAVSFSALGVVFGIRLPFSVFFVALIRDRHPGTVNLGIGGNGPLMMLAGLKEYLAALRPRVVLWFYFEGNDVTKDLFRERRSALLIR